MKKANCVICGKEFEYEKGNKICCSKECSSERIIILQRWRRRMANRGNNKLIKANKTSKADNDKPNKIKSIAEVQKEARRRGMSYGMYIARIDGGMR